MPSVDTKEQDIALNNHRSPAKTMTVPEEQCDSGLSSIGPGSMGPISQDGYLPSLNLNCLPEHPEEAEAMDEVEDALLNLKIDSCYTRAEDSGVYNSVPLNSLREGERTVCNQCSADIDTVDRSSCSSIDTVPTMDNNTRRLVLCPTMEQMVSLYEGDREGDNHLHLSIIHGHKMFSLFLINNVPQYDWLSFGNLLRQTPLHLAVLTRQPEIVRRLICAGACVTAQDKQGDTPLHIACRNGYREIVRHLLTPVTYEETLQNADSIPFQRVPQDQNIRNGDGETCLHVASRAGHIDVVQMLLAAGANVNARDAKSGRTVLHMAAETNDTELAEMLLSRSDIVVSSKNYEGRTPVQLAYGRNHTALVSIICRYTDTGDQVTLSDFSDFEISDDEDMSDDTETSGYDSNMS